MDKNNGQPLLTQNDLLDHLLQAITPVDFKLKAGILPGQAMTKKHYVVICADEIIELAKKKQYDISLSHNRLYMFNGEYWHPIDDNKVKNFLGKAAIKMGVYKIDAKHYSFKDDLFKQFLSSSFFSITPKAHNEVLINLRNGTFSITPQTQKLRPFDKKDFLTYQLPFAFDPTADAPLFQRYLSQVLPDPNQQLILAEFAGYVFVPSKTLKLEKALILLGNGANGKSVFFEILIALLGKANVSNYSLKALTDQQGYYRAKIDRKLLNYASEISTSMDSTVFKQLISGEPLETRLPYKEPVIIEDYAKLMFNTNELPRDVEENEAFFRRFLILMFGITISEEDRDPELARKIIQNELPGVFNWVLNGLNRLLIQKRFTQSVAVEQVLDAYKAGSDTIKTFIDEEGFEKSNSDYIALKALYMMYRKSCIDIGDRPCGSKQFPDRLRLRGFHIDRRNTGMVVYIAKKLF